jgi:two-component system, probable response regulator PhcQ
MSPDKILYVDDEPMALKYFERLVSPLAPVITTLSGEEGKVVLRERAREIAVLVTDQRMPGAHGNELLRFTREYHPRIVRMLTTAYSELGEAIEAINSGEIYRYITKPWELGSLHADLRNALELAELRNERDHLLGQKLIVQQQGLLGSRLASLAMLGGGLFQGIAHSNAQGNMQVDLHAGDTALHGFARAALAAGCNVPDASWNQWDQAGLLQAEAWRGIAIARELRRWQGEFGSDRTPERAVAVLAQATGGELQGAAVQLPSAAVLTALLDGNPGEVPATEAIAWLAWLLWWNAPVQVKAGDEGRWMLLLPPAGDSASAPPPDWLERMIEAFAESPMASH